MINTKFEAYKIIRELKRSGNEYIFTREELNAFNEPTDDENEVCRLLGLYHEQNGSISITTGDTTQTRTKKTPMILCLYEDAKLINSNDIVRFNSKTYKVTGVVNIQEWNIIADISLEFIDEVDSNGN